MFALLEGIIKNLGMGRAAVLSVIIDGFSVLHCAASHGHLEVCKYLVEGLGGDPNMVAGVAEFEGPSLFSLVLKIGRYHMYLPLAVSGICMFYLY